MTHYKIFKDEEGYYEAWYEAETFKSKGKSLKDFQRSKKKDISGILMI